MMSLEERIDRDSEFAHVLNKEKLRFLHKSTLSINGFCNSQQFDSICLDYAYQLVESVLSYGKYEISVVNNCNNIFKCSLLNWQQTVFYENEFYQNNQAQIAQKPFNIPGTFDA